MPKKKKKKSKPSRDSPIEYKVDSICLNCIGTGIMRLTSPSSGFGCAICGGSGNKYIPK